MLKKPIFLKGNSNWIDELSFVTKKYNETIHHSIKMTPIEASKKLTKMKSILIYLINEKSVIQNIN